jgi:hypothetical protein
MTSLFEPVTAPVKDEEVLAELGASVERAARIGDTDGNYSRGHRLVSVPRVRGDVRW